ncbi:MAG: hypothetical protein ACSHX8_06210 [Opitutaceae bacterium]
MRALILLLIAFLFAGKTYAATPHEIARDAIETLAGPEEGPWRRLFLDSYVVEKSQNTERVFHRADKHPANPIIVKDRWWEGSDTRSGPYLYGTVLEEEGKFRMWYHAYRPDVKYITCYAESDDGIFWVKPILNQVTYGASSNNNIVVPFTEGSFHNVSVIRQDWESDPAKRYALYCYNNKAARVLYSADGKTWVGEIEAVQTPLFPTGDVVNCTYDPYKKRYVATRKLTSRRGRSVGIATSQNGIDWSIPVDGPIFVPDDLDPDETQIYGMPTFAYQGMYVGLPWIYNARWVKGRDATAINVSQSESRSPKTIDVQLSWSWDLINWTRPFPRDQFIERGGEDDFDSQMIYTSQKPVIMGDELWFYYGGNDAPHGDIENENAIGIATLRLDGFCSIQAGDTEGWFVSRMEHIPMPSITINAKTDAGGYIVAELLDLNGKLLDGWSRDLCIPFEGDSVRHALQWRESADSAPLAHARKIRFFIKNADIYSYICSFDKDRDGLSDLWEQQYLGSLDGDGSDDTDGDGYDDRIEYHLGTDPMNQASKFDFKLGSKGRVEHTPVPRGMILKCVWTTSLLVPEGSWEELEFIPEASGFELPDFSVEPYNLSPDSSVFIKLILEMEDAA